MINELLTPILNRQTPDVNFFEGRLLTGRDLRDQQDADQHRFQHLGQAIGAGIINGLEVELVEKGSIEKEPVLKVKAGTALNAEGKLLELELDKNITFNLHKPPDLGDGHFADCPQVRDFTGFTNTGIYILVMSLASGYSTEQAPKVGLNDQGIAKDCGHRYSLKGVQFRVEELKPYNLNGISDETRSLFASLLDSSDLPGLSKLQNLVAHLCFGTEVLEGFARDPFSVVNGDSAFKKYGAVDDLTELERITDCDIPLAVIHWTRQGIGFLDLWSVRRQLTTGLNSEPPFIFTDRYIAEANARFAQFQDHIQFLLLSIPVPTSIEVKNYFFFLPPSGFLPLIGQEQPKGFSAVRFFNSFTLEPPKQIESSLVGKLLLDSLFYGSIDLNKARFIQTYHIRFSDINRPFLMFAASEIPYIADMPRFGDLCQTLLDARDAYRRLVTQNVFLRTEISPSSAPARSVIIAGIQGVVTVAGSWNSTCNVLTQLNAGLNAIKDLYQLQKDLTEVFLQILPELEDPIDVRTFANQLRLRLDGTVMTAVPDLNTALEEGLLPTILASQNEINRLVFGQTTSQPVIGNVTVIYQISNRGLTLVMEDNTPFGFNFNIRNNTNRVLDIQLEARFLLPRETWTPFTTIRDESGSEIAFITLQPFDSELPDDLVSERTITVEVTTPPIATEGQVGNLQLRAFIPAPVNRAGADSVELTVGVEGVQEQPVSVRIQPNSPVPDSNPTRARVNNTITFTFALLFHAETGELARDFTMVWNVVSGDSSLYRLMPPSESFVLRSDLETDIFPRIRPLPDAEGSTITLEAIIESVDGSVPVLTSSPLSITTPKTTE